MSTPMTSSTGSEAEPDARSFAHLVADLLEQLPELLRAELRLAQAEVAQKSTQVGRGAGLLSASGVVALFGVGAGIATGIIALAEVLPAWAAGLVVTGGLLLLAGLLALVGLGQVKRGSPPVPEKAIAGVQEDVATLKEVTP